MEINWSQVESKIGIKFKHSDYLRLALTHPSYAEQLGKPEENNERLEFLGKSMLNLACIDYLYRNCPYLEAGKLSKLRDKLVEGERLTKLWFQMELGASYPFLALKEERYQLRQKSNNPFASAFKALVGAIYLDRGYLQTRKWIDKHLIAPLLERYQKDIKERFSHNKQLQLLGNALLKAIVAEYLYNLLPGMKEKGLSSLAKNLLKKEKVNEYNSQLTKQDLAVLKLGDEIVPTKPFKPLLGAIYVDYHTENDKTAFAKTSKWLANKFLDEEKTLQRGISLLLKDGYPKKWIIHNILGYESKNYQAGKDKYNEIMTTTTS
ncbi:MAG: ribonuclease III domain-containing protein [Oscillatoria sp. PMC 1051.18]|nr:ribonuclease III domain-containing protein [Oscillatoria sp. PMC 1050.18]MEC5029578.1 ribonuclease III domain-containing protein [Oscillatoria sp. PMC 1051.18]